MPRRCAALLFPAPNSEVVAISLTIVFEITDIFSPVLKVFVADYFAFFAFSKKYLTFFLWIMSKRVPAATITAIKITNDCIKIGDIVSAKIENGFVDNIMLIPSVMKVFSIVVKRDQPLYRGQFVTAFE